MTTRIEMIESGIRMYKNMIKRSDIHSAARTIKWTFADTNVNKVTTMRLIRDQTVNDISA